jgi:hypothetical protein
MLTPVIAVGKKYRTPSVAVLEGRIQLLRGLGNDHHQIHDCDDSDYLKPPLLTHCLHPSHLLGTINIIDSKDRYPNLAI